MESRDSQVSLLSKGKFYVLVIGGGINGAATALSYDHIEAALVDAQNFSACSSKNSLCLIWGGIVYLKDGEFFLAVKLILSTINSPVI